MELGKNYERGNIILLQKICLIIITILLSYNSVSADQNYNYDVYGSMRFASFYMSYDDVQNHSEYEVESIMQNNSRIGVELIHKNGVSGVVELGKGKSGENINIRKFYASYRFLENWDIIIGQTYTPLNFFPSNQVATLYDGEGDNGLFPFGGVRNNYEPMIQISSKNVKFALIQPCYDIDKEVLMLGETGNIRKRMPKIELSYHYGKSKFIDLFFGCQLYTIETENKDYYDIISAATGVNIGFDFFDFYGFALGYTGRNIGVYNLWAEGDSLPRIINNDVENNTTYGYNLGCGYQISKSSSIELGTGYIEHSIKENTTSDKCRCVYLNISCIVWTNFYIVPEIGFVDYMDDFEGKSEGSLFYCGLKTQLNF